MRPRLLPHSTVPFAIGAAGDAARGGSARRQRSHLELGVRSSVQIRARWCWNFLSPLAAIPELSNPSRSRTRRSCSVATSERRSAHVLDASRAWLARVPPRTGHASSKQVPAVAPCASDHVCLQVRMQSSRPAGYEVWSTRRARPELARAADRDRSPAIRERDQCCLPDCSRCPAAGRTRRATHRRPWAGSRCTRPRSGAAWRAPRGCC
jgi:hypothetical protein